MGSSAIRWAARSWATVLANGLAVSVTAHQCWTKNGHGLFEQFSLVHVQHLFHWGRRTKAQGFGNVHLEAAIHPNHLHGGCDQTKQSKICPWDCGCISLTQGYPESTLLHVGEGTWGCWPPWIEWRIPSVHAELKLRVRKPLFDTGMGMLSMHCHRSEGRLRQHLQIPKFSCLCRNWDPCMLAAHAHGVANRFHLVQTTGPMYEKCSQQVKFHGKRKRNPDFLLTQAYPW